MSYASTSPQSASPVSSAAHVRRGAQLMVLAFVANAIASAPAKLMAAIAERYRIARAIAQLEALSDRILADIGVERGEIPRLVRQGRD
jgi:uncharacterized protein YjiS (DUF1127 family)